MGYTNNKKITEWLKANLNAEKFSHSLGAAEYAGQLALKYGLDKDKAYTAGLLHDCAKCFDEQKLYKIIKENIDVHEDELLNRKTLHAPVSAYIAQKEFGVTDNEILSAIRWHTLGKTDMSDFDKIVFLADKIEPNTRQKDFRQKIEKLLEHGLDRALLECYRATIESLVKRDLKICPLTIEIYNKLLG
jgi:nicotinate-nucleotide adenylyltransferase